MRWLYYKKTVIFTSTKTFGQTSKRESFTEGCERSSVRVSFARNNAGAPEITGTNNYYPFGLNHIGGGNIS
ncbi:hypothetical protein, partial [Chryseobacterium indologenes]